MNILRQLQSDFHATATSPTGRRTMRRLATTTPALAEFTDLTDVLRHLRHADHIDSASILNALLHHAPTEPLAHRTLIEAFTPCVAHRLNARRYAEHDLDDYANELLAALIRGINRIAAEPPNPYPATLIRRSIDRAAIVWTRRYDEQPEPLQLIDDYTQNVLLNPLEGDALRPTRADRLIATLITAVQAGTVSAEDAAFVARSIVNGEPARIEAARRCYTERAVRKRLHRTVAVLAQHHAANAA